MMPWVSAIKVLLSRCDLSFNHRESLQKVARYMHMAATGSWIIQPTALISQPATPISN